MTVYEALSRLLSGDLSPEEAAHWESRIASDEDVRRAWAQLQRMTQDLASEPEPAVPDRLVHAVLAAQEPAPLRDVPWRWIVGMALAAGLAWFTWTAWPAPPPTLTLVHGEQRVQGVARVVAGGVPVHVEGVASIRVQPAEQPLREGRQEARMQSSSAVAFGAGVVVTVVVSQGVAWFEGPRGEVVHVGPGETRMVAATVGAAHPPQGVPALTPGAQARPAREAQLQASIEALTFERDLLRGQLASLQGPLSWPPDYAPQLQPGPFEQGIQEALRGVGDVVDVDCAAYPCLALVEVGEGDAMEIATEVANAVRAWTEQLDDDLNINVSLRAHGEHTRAGIVIAEDGDHAHPEVEARVEELMAQP